MGGEGFAMGVQVEESKRWRVRDRPRQASMSRLIRERTIVVDATAGAKTRRRLLASQLQDLIVASGVKQTYGEPPPYQSLDESEVVRGT